MFGVIIRISRVIVAEAGEDRGSGWTSSPGRTRHWRRGRAPPTRCQARWSWPWTPSVTRRCSSGTGRPKVWCSGPWDGVQFTGDTNSLPACSCLCGLSPRSPMAWVLWDDRDGYTRGTPLDCTHACVEQVELQWQARTGSSTASPSLPNSSASSPSQIVPTLAFWKKRGE
uniref:Uncharacterized protein n=1 Tax=Oryza brachyantha TaxID=4533 RepID=J3MAE3_ORYBR